MYEDGDGDGSDIEYNNNSDAAAVVYQHAKDDGDLTEMYVKDFER